MLNDATTLLRSLARAAWNGAQLLTVSLAAFILAVVAIVAVVVGVVAKLTAALLGYLAGLIRETLPFLLSLVPVLAQAALILATGASMVLVYPYLWMTYAGDTGSLVVGGMIAAGLVLAPAAWAALSGRWAALIGAITGTWAVWGLAHMGAGARTFVVLAPLAVVTVSEVFNGRTREHARRQYQTLADAGQAGLDDRNRLHDLERTSTLNGR